MKSRFLIILIVISFSIHVTKAQEYYLVKSNNDTVFAETSIEVKNPLLRKNAFIIDYSSVVFAEEVIKYNSQRGYFKRVPDGKKFAKLIIEGNKIDQYSTDLIEYSHSYFKGYGGRGGLSYILSSDFYYSIYDGKLKDMNYKNLKADVYKDDLSMMYLQKVKKLKVWSGVIYAIGVGVLSYGIVKSGFVTADRDALFYRGEKKYISPFLFGGLAVIAIPPLFLSKSKTKNLRLAISSFNRH